MTDAFANLDQFEQFPKIARLSREIVITEKIDGTNAQIAIGEDSSFRVGSRTRWLENGEDNAGFAFWATRNKDELIAKLGPGRHFGEWWGKGIQRGYNQTEKRFSLFNVHRWGGVETRPACCGVVPEIWRGPFDTNKINEAMARLQSLGSFAAPGFMKPEGIMIFHTQGNVMFKKTFEADEAGKSYGS